MMAVLRDLVQTYRFNRITRRQERRSDFDDVRTLLDRVAALCWPPIQFKGQL
jgi:hypothetical protein